MENTQPESHGSDSNGARGWRQRVSAGAHAVFGNIDWQPPAWTGALRTRVQAQPMRWWGGTLAVALLLLLGLWWANRPKVIDPDAVTAEVSAPEITDYTKTPPTFSPLRLRFAGPVAPIALVGKAPKGVTLAPAHPGQWLWSDDRTLVFTPAKDWPIGTAFTIALDAKVAIAPKVKLAQDEFEFSTAPFKAEVASAEFYQDPQDPNLKKAVYALGFSHPVDAASLEAQLGFTYADGGGRALPAPGKTLTFDEHRLKAWVHSAPLQLPENGGKLVLEVDEGVRSTLGGEGTQDALTATVDLPKLYSVSVDSIEATLAENDRYEPEQVVVLGFNQAMRDSDVARAIEVRLLPDADPRKPPGERRPGHFWSTADVDETVLAQSPLLPLTAVPSEREFIETHGFKYKAPPNRFLHVRVAKGLKSFGGFILGQNKFEVVRVPPYPELLRFVGEGALLSLRGERRVSVAARNVSGLRLEVARVLPGALHQLVQNNGGDYAKPSFDYLSEDSLVEREETRLRFPPGDPAKTRYEGIDLGPFLAEGRRGVFLLSLRDLSDYDAGKPASETLADDAGSEYDRRLVVLTDLGVLAKRALDGSRDVFVQSIAAGTPVSGATVRAVGRNGSTLVTATTDADGRARLPTLQPFKREKQAVMLTVEQGGDLSFLPLDAEGRVLDYSRFEIGGEDNALESGELKASLFSDRGLYRPGDTVHLGMIVRAADWSRPLAGLPLELLITDPRGTLARRERLSLGDVGFETFDYTPSDAAASGTWTAQLYLIGKNDERTEIGSTTIQVRDFQPDSMRVQARFSQQVAEGWVKPAGLKALVHAENLFGTPAQDRKVEASVVLRPAFPDFASWKGWDFYDPQRAKDGYDDTLPDAKTNAQGDAEIPLGLEKYDRATYQLSVLVRAFEPGSGRNVAASATTLVSDNPYLIGIKRDDELGYVKRGSKRSAQLVAIGPDARPIRTQGLRAVLVERRHVSVLTKQNSGLYKYVSQLRLDDRNETAFDFAGKPRSYALPTDKPGDWRLEIRDAKGVALNRVDYSVAGQANLTRDLERNAELTLSLSKDSYKPGEEIEISVRAPYPGAGLITIERDRVYAHAWFKTDSNSSVQKIRVPEGLEGNAYVNVQFVRNPDSDEVFMSPLSYGVAPFWIDRSARKQSLSIRLPKVSKPGAEIPLTITTQGKARVVAFAVDEGILQVARYKVADPLDTFFAKKMLQVDTAQILDLILPEFSRLVGRSAPGGDAGGDLAKNLNPFKRKAEKPAVWWSGPMNIDGERTVRFRLPDHFNGSYRVVAIAVTPARVGIAQTTAIARGDFVLTPTLPTHLAPGDEFELPIGVANTIDNSRVAGGKATLPVTVALALPRGLSLVGPASATLQLAPGREATARLRLRAGQRLGAFAVGISARSGRYAAQRRIELSIRPAVHLRQDLRVGFTSKPYEIKPLRAMFPELSRRRIAASSSPLVAIDGVAAYLADYPHLCTEQLVSAGIPALVDAKHPEFGLLHGTGAKGSVRALDALRARQNGDGGFGSWSATPEVDPFVSAYGALYLVEARERGIAVPSNTLDAANAWLQSLAADRALTTLPQLRARAMAVYLLVRQGRSAGNLLSAVREQLEASHPKTWKQDDATALFIAASYQLLQQDAAASPLAEAALKRANAKASTVAPGFVEYYDAAIAQGWSVYLLHKHFPQLASRITGTAIARLLEPLRNDRYNTLSSALILLAMEARGGRPGTLPGLQAIDATGKARAIGEASGLLRAGAFNASDRAVRVLPASGTTAWYALTQNGFDRKPPPAVQDQGIELVREYLDAAGKQLTRLPIGGEVTVRLRVRALGNRAYSDVAIVDLLPGGFETVMQTPPPANDTDCEDCGNEPVAPTLALPGTTFIPEHVEPREDRVLLYGNVGSGMQEFRYKIRAGNAGRFAVPPVYAEAMYERGVYAQGEGGTTLEVGTPAP